MTFESMPRSNVPDFPIDGTWKANFIVFCAHLLNGCFSSTTVFFPDIATFVCLFVLAIFQPKR